MYAIGFTYSYYVLMLALEYMHKQRCTAHVVYIERLKHHKTCMHAVIGGLLVSQCSEKGKLSKGIDQNERSVHAASN